ncbi:carboxypeptidase T [Halopolyspora algeriensis]|uniref:Zinc carboxypeptidase n=1 Tax=Halopolyspora algeriensis TaxID=1500506 RepID=A0A368VNY9_9ACTN|nr:M14 family metallopeptidase [Halopolyspora algeriensis]RCW43238.1 carboxypeptidase T [Halopolyspora algeriensis]TQM56297.1 carboxypeptidase T [Halopolyspora algeriensis]
MFPSRRRIAVITAAAALLLTPAVEATVAAEPRPTPEQETARDTAIYTVPNTDSRSRTAIMRNGALVLSVRDGTATVEATPQQAARLREAGFELRGKREITDALPPASGNGLTAGFPPQDRDYHTYTEMVAELGTAVAEHPGLAVQSSAGSSAMGRDIPVLKISDNVTADENEPEVLFTCNQHAREHLTTEMCLHIVQRYTDGYASDPAIAEMVDTREIWIVPMVNPDGSVHDVSGVTYRGWRRNRESTPTDLNRNWGHKWGCCGGSSGDPNASTYRGPAPFSAPETSAIRDFTDSRVIDGEQQITAHIDFHTFSELVLWPYGYTENNTAPGMTREEYDRFARTGRAMAATNGYTPQQSSDLYVTDGSVNDWMWAEHDILSFTFEMYPASGGIEGFYPPDEVIPRETARNDAAVSILLREAGRV